LHLSVIPRLVRGTRGGTVLAQALRTSRGMTLKKLGAASARFALIP
jgi:hypothetical protein